MSTYSIALIVAIINLGGIFYKRVSMNEHDTSACRAAYYHLKNVHRLEEILTQEALVTAVYAIVAYLLGPLILCLVEGQSARLMPPNFVDNQSNSKPITSIQFLYLYSSG